MGYVLGPVAPISGPCLYVQCDTTPGVGYTCGGGISNCKAGSQNSTSFINPNESGMCDYTLYDSLNNLLAQCVWQPLSGTVSGTGTAWSIYDATTTVAITYTVVTQLQGVQDTLLFVDPSKTNAYSHFFAGTAAAAILSPTSATNTFTAAPASSTVAAGTTPTVHSNLTITNASITPSKTGGAGRSGLPGSKVCLAIGAFACLFFTQSA